MTNQIIHDPTRGWLLLTPDGQIEIAREDWKNLDRYFPNVENIAVFKFHHPYSVDSEFEVKEQYRYKEPKKGWTSWVDKEVVYTHKDGRTEFEYRKIARLVKAKEKPDNDMKLITTCTGKINQMGICDTCYRPAQTSSSTCGRLLTSKANTGLLPEIRPTDSVTTDPDYTNYTPPKQETESQDELWTEVWNQITVRGNDEVGLREAFKIIQSRFRIERI